VIDVQSGQQNTADYLEINPAGRVPALRLPNQRVITEAPAILAYLGFTDCRSPLRSLPDDTLASIFTFNNYLSSTVHVAHAHKRRGERWADDVASLEDMKRRVPLNMAACFRLIHESMFVGPWALGDFYSIVDPLLFVVTGWLEQDGVSLADYPKIQSHKAAMLKRPPVQRAMAMVSAD
jgi:glutathione S-transferase